MLHFFNQINELNTKILYQKEEFGLLNESREYLPHFAEGTMQTIAYTSWAIYLLKINFQTCRNENFTISTSSKCLIFNIDDNNIVQWHSDLGITSQISPNTGVFLNTIEKSIQLDFSSSLNLIIIELKDNYFQQGLFHPSLQQIINTIFDKNDRLPFSISSQLIDYIDDIKQSSKRGVCQLMFLNAKIFEILSDLIDNLEYASIQKNAHPYQVQLDQVKKIINEKLHIQFSINDLAKSVGLNTSYLKKYFKEAYQETIFEYATKTRINYAKELLITTDLPISSIAEKIGYQQGAHFSYAFKKNTHLTPNQFRSKKP